MEPVNKPGKRRRGGSKKRKANQKAGLHELTSPAVSVTSPELDVLVNPQGSSALHTACRRGQLAAIQFLLDSRPGWINGRDEQGRRPVHVVLSSLSSPNTLSCVRYLLEHGADVCVSTDSGVTPLHLAASEGLLDCAEMLVQAGADVQARDNMDLTPLDYARIWCHRKVARYLKNCLWQREKEKELKERKLVQVLYRDLVDEVHLKDSEKKTLISKNMTEWATKKGLPPPKDFTPRVQEKFHTTCLSAHHTTTQNQEDKKPWTIYLPEKPLKGEPDLRRSVTLWRDSRKVPVYATKWDHKPQLAPDLPLDTLKRVLFPREFPSRIKSPPDFDAQDIMEVQHRGHPQGRSTSPWTEVAMHLVEVLESGHY